MLTVHSNQSSPGDKDRPDLREEEGGEERRAPSSLAVSKKCQGTMIM